MRHKRWWLWLLLTFSLGMLPQQHVYAVDPEDGQVDLPLNRMGQSQQQQKSANDNVHLFQNSQVGDLGKQQRHQLHQRYQHLFTHPSSKITLYNDHDLFNRNNHAGQVNYSQAVHHPDTQRHHYYALLVIGTLTIGIIFSWRMVKKHE